MVRRVLRGLGRWIHRRRCPHYEADFAGEPSLMLVELPGGREAHVGKRLRHAEIRNTHPWNRYFSHPLRFYARTLAEMDQFLRGCEYRRDRETRSRDDFWEPPDEFEVRRRGDCEDHALWAWRQLVEMGCEARFVLGHRHAWVHVFVEDRCYLMEATNKHWWPPDASRYMAHWSVEKAAPKGFAFFAHFREGSG